MGEPAKKAGKSKPQKKAKSPAMPTNDQKKSLVKVVVSTDMGKWVAPAKDSTHSITSDAQFPTIKFEIETDAAPPYQWTWTITWDAKVSGLRESATRGKKLKAFAESGRFESSSKSWTASLGKVVGGRLEVQVVAGTDRFRRGVTIKGMNPSADDLSAYLKTLNDVVGFDKIVEQETRGKHFISADGQPIVAFDAGYGMTQLTKPAPTYEQIWNWKENVKGGAKLYQAKQKEARKYLSQSKRTYTNDQLKLETWSRWNGGGYHTWDATAKVWVRNDSMLCDSKTGNIGWNQKAELNKEKTESELHERDKDTYKDPKARDKAAHPWQYSGICYADHLDD